MEVIFCLTYSFVRGPCNSRTNIHLKVAKPLIFPLFVLKWQVFLTSYKIQYFFWILDLISQEHLWLLPYHLDNGRFCFALSNSGSQRKRTQNTVDELRKLVLEAGWSAVTEKNFLLVLRIQGVLPGIRSYMNILILAFLP